MEKVLHERARRVSSLLVGVGMFAAVALAQLPTGSILGVVKDSSGAVVPGATVTARNVETGQTRTSVSAADGSYRFSALSVGGYELRAEQSGFQTAVRSGLTLTVGQEAVINFTLGVGAVTQTIAVTGEAPLVNTTLSSISGLVAEQAIKDMPLNGRSFDQLLTLNVGVVSYAAISSVTRTGNLFSVAGRREESNRFLVNGVEYIGTNAGGSMITPFGASGSLLGVDAVREFNVVQHTYGAEYGKRVGGQVSIVTSGGTNRLHGSAFEYLRNSVLDARNFFDFPRGERIPPFKRNQFGGALGGPIRKDRLFLFGNYEGFRQRLGISSVAFVPDLLARQGSLPIGPNGSVVPVPNLKTGILPFLSLYWAEPNGPGLGGGVAYQYANPLQKIREDFGSLRVDYNKSSQDSLAVNYMLDDGENNSPSANPNFHTVSPQRNQLLGLQETHVFSPAVLNVANLGFSRANLLAHDSAAVPFPESYYFITGTGPGAISVGGQINVAGGGALTGGSGARTGRNPRNYFTWADDFHYLKGKHSWSAGGWIQRIQQNTFGPGGFTSGTVTYPSLLAFLQDAPTQFQGTPNPVFVGWRSTEAAWYLQDEVKLQPNLMLRLGLRYEMTSGWNEAHGRAATFVFDANGAYKTDPVVSSSALTENNAKALWQPRVGLAWDPTGSGKWAVRAGAGIYHDLQDNLGFRASGNPPFASRVTFTGVPLLSIIPISGSLQPPPACTAELQAAGQRCSIFAPGGLEPNLHTPTSQQWSFSVERGITTNLMLEVGYVGSQSYHEQMPMGRNAIPPQVCSDPQGCASGGVRGAVARVPPGTTYVPPGLLPNRFLAAGVSFWFAGNSSYHALNVSVVKRASHGLSFKANYSFSKVLDLNSAYIDTFAANEPYTALNPYNLAQNKGVAAFNIKHQFNGHFSYQLPLGRGQRWGSGFGPVVNKLVEGWQWNGIVTVQSGFPFTPKAGSNRSGNGDTFIPDVVNRNPAFRGPIIQGRPERWYDPNAFLLPTLGTFGNVSRGAFVGPDLANVDASLFKNFSINERWSLQFRAEAFNILNRVNFGVPNTLVFSGNDISPSAGSITKTATASRQLQLALKLVF